MRPVEFTDEQVIEAGCTLQAQGRNITGFALRKLVGGGDPTRLKQRWDAHQASTAAGEPETVVELPIEVANVVDGLAVELAGRLKALAVEVNDKAVKAAERRVSEVVKAAGEQASQAERELSDAATAVDELETVVAELQEQVQAKDRAYEALRQANQQQAVELAELRERMKNEQEKVQELRGELDKAKERAESNQQRADSLLQQFQAAEARIEQLHADDVKAREQINQVSQQLAETKGALLAESAITKQARTELQEAQERAQDDRAARSKAEQEAARLRGALEAKDSHVAELLQRFTVQPPAQEGATDDAAQTKAKPAAKKMTAPKKKPGAQT